MVMILIMDIVMVIEIENSWGDFDQIWLKYVLLCKDELIRIWVKEGKSHKVIKENMSLSQ